MRQAGEMNELDTDGPTPTLRFPEFDDGGAWQRETLRRLASPVKDKATGSDNEDTLTLSGEMGLVPQGDYFGKQISGENVSRYIKIVRDDFVYNDRTTKASKFGSIKRLTSTDGGIVSPIYKCFRFKGGQNPDFWDYYFEAQAHEAQLGGLVNEGARAGRFNISIDKFLSIHVWKPSSPEQERIAECLASIDALIEAETEKLDALKDHKQGLMQQLFPADGESLPALRFPEFRELDAWETCLLDDLCAMRAGQFIRASEIQDAPANDLYPCYGGNGLRGYVETYTHEGRFPLIGRQGALCGNVKLAEEQFHATEHAIVATPKRSVDVDWLFYLLDFMQLNKHATGQAQPGLSVGALERLSAWKPCEREQTQIASALRAADELIASQEAKVCSLQSHKQGLLQQLFPVLDEVDG